MIGSQCPQQVSDKRIEDRQALAAGLVGRHDGATGLPDLFRISRGVRLAQQAEPALIVRRGLDVDRTDLVQPPARALDRLLHGSTCGQFLRRQSCHQAAMDGTVFVRGAHAADQFLNLRVAAHDRSAPAMTRMYSPRAPLAWMCSAN